jgi:hypothetical protein
LCRKFDTNGDGCIDCQEFLFNFFRTGRIERDKFFHENLNKTRLIQTREKQRKQLYEKKFIDRTVVKLSDISTEPPKKSVRQTILKKVRDVAQKYQNNMNFTNPWAAFQSTSMPLTVLKEQLRNCFEIFASKEELYALIKEFPDESNPEEMNCANFMTYFFRVGQRAREKQLERRKMKEERLNTERRLHDLELQEKYIRSKETRVVWPTLSLCKGDSSVNMDLSCTLNSCNSFNSSDDLNPMSEGSQHSRSRRATRKAVLETLSPIKATPLKRGESFADLFPSVSLATQVRHTSYCISISYF